MSIHPCSSTARIDAASKILSQLTVTLVFATVAAWGARIATTAFTVGAIRQGAESTGISPPATKTSNLAN